MLVTHQKVSFAPMEDILTETVLRGALVVRKDLFGEDSVFVRFEKQDVAKFRHQQFDGLQSSLLFGRIAYRRRKNYDETERYSDDLILKRKPSTVLMKYFGTLPFHNEAFFYANMLPFFETLDDKQPLDENIRSLFPQYYNSLLQLNANLGEAVIVLENLRTSGFSPPAKKSFLDYDHLRLMMRKLGQFHAYSYRARERNPNEFCAMARCQLDFTGHYFTYFPRLKRCMTRGLEPLKSDPHYSSKIVNVSRLIGQTDEVYRKALAGDESNPTHVVCHGDYIRNNVLFAYNESSKPIDMKISDLGTWRFASPVFDLAVVLYICADQSMRDENWNNLLDEYYAAISRTCTSTDVPTKDSIMAEFKTEAVLVAYFIASMFLPRLVASDNKGDVPEKADLVPTEYNDVRIMKLPPDLMDLVFNKEGGNKATVALTNILKDMIDRGFV